MSYIQYRTLTKIGMLFLEIFHSTENSYVVSTENFMYTPKLCTLYEFWYAIYSSTPKHYNSKFIFKRTE